MFGFTLWLLVAIQIEIVMDLVIFISSALFIKALEQNTPPYSHQIFRELRVYGITSFVFSMIGEPIGILIFWVFAIKYWRVSIKLQLIQRNLPLDKYRKVT